MNQSERRIFLIKYLLSEENFTSAIPPDEATQKRMLRAYMNMRMPRKASEEFLRVQDEYLREELRPKGITDIAVLTPVAPDLYLWQGDITTLECDGIVNAANSQMFGCFQPTLPRLRQAHDGQPSLRRHVRAGRRLYRRVRAVRTVRKQARRLPHAVLGARRGRQYSRDNQISVLANDRAKHESDVRLRESRRSVRPAADRKTLDMRRRRYRRRNNRIIRDPKLAGLFFCTPAEREPNAAYDPKKTDCGIIIEIISDNEYNAFMKRF